MTMETRAWRRHCKTLFNPGAVARGIAAAKRATQSVSATIASGGGSICIPLAIGSVSSSFLSGFRPRIRRRDFDASGRRGGEFEDSNAQPSRTP